MAVPGAPQNLTALPNETTATLTWNRLTGSNPAITGWDFRIKKSTETAWGAWKSMTGSPAATLESWNKNKGSLLLIGAESKNILDLVTDTSIIKSLTKDSNNILTVAGLADDLGKLAAIRGVLVSIGGREAAISAVADVSQAVVSIASKQNAIEAVADDSTNILAAQYGTFGVLYDTSMINSGPTTPDGDGEYGFYTFTNAITSAGKISIGATPQRTSTGIKASKILVLSYKNQDGIDVTPFIKSISFDDVLTFRLSKAHYYVFRVDDVRTRNSVKAFLIELIDSKESGVGISWLLASQQITIEVNKQGGYAAISNVVKESKTIVSIAGQSVDITGLIQIKSDLTAIAGSKGDIDEIIAQWTVKTQVNSLVGGIGLYNDGSNVQFGIRADRFWVMPSSGTSTQKLANKAIPFKITSGKVYIDEAYIKNLQASTITSGTFSSARIPGLSASKITSGSFPTGRIPSLSANKITSGSFTTGRIPGLTASKITSGTLSDSRIPGLAASKITSGSFSTGRIPQLDILDKAIGNKIESVGGNRWSYYWEDKGIPPSWSRWTQYSKDALVSRPPSGDAWNRLYIAKRSTSNDYPESSPNDWGQILRWTKGEGYASANYYRYFGYQDGTTNRVYRSKRRHTADDFSKPAQPQQGFFLDKDGTSYIRAAEFDEINLNTANITGKLNVNFLTGSIGSGLTLDFDSVKITGTLAADKISSNVWNVELLGTYNVQVGWDDNINTKEFTLSDDYVDYDTLFIAGAAQSGGKTCSAIKTRFIGSSFSSTSTITMAAGDTSGYVSIMKIWDSDTTANSYKKLKIAGESKDKHQGYIYSIYGLKDPGGNKGWIWSRNDDFDLASANSTAGGIAYYNSKFWVTDSSDRKVYVYTTSGTRSTSDEFNLASANSNAWGITYYNNKFWVIDSGNDKVYVYTTSGTRSTSDEFNLASANSNARWITYYNNKFWVIDSGNDKVYVYTTSGTRSTSDEFNLASANSNPRGITYYNNKFWVIDFRDNKVYVYTTSGTRSTSDEFNLASANSNHWGIEYYNNKFWVVDQTDDKVYAYKFVA